ncbi:hypothetical protein BJ684DRAFT_18834 [Piptocephalis cylindrospora]|uniref:G-protein coupled receptors family 1 profile domain-containing protein n=1 Tax=Piptocephalis cylindrospora TaxID=1907219 RepID=A0A4P9Y9S9_9FUNG|nr:hypothetical protein BJ684DRAFT_18834 [Piptocephalis cylindrospora]|eukprot:RKP14790.1 hypothetical protein BJ684DRAFT_18834 [Piptocephalis cylindrospora]
MDHPYVVKLADVDWKEYQIPLRIHSIALVLLSASFCCSATILLLSWAMGRTRTIGHRIPIYLGICDIFASGIHIIDHIYSLMNRHPFPPAQCTAVAAVFSFWINCSLFLVSTMAISIFYGVYRHTLIDFGRYDWKLLVTTMIGSLVFVSLGLGFRAYGSSGYWCYIDPMSPWGMSANTFYHFTLPLGVLSICFFCYSLTFRKMRQNARALQVNQFQSFGSASARTLIDRGVSSRVTTRFARFLRSPLPSSSPEEVNEDKEGVDSASTTLAKGTNTKSFTSSHTPSGARALRVQWRVVRHISAYVFIFIVQWTPIMCVVLYMLTLWDGAEVPDCIVALFTTGGIMHLLAFIWNLKDQDSDSHSRRSISSTASPHIGPSPLSQGPGTSSSQGTRFAQNDIYEYSVDQDSVLSIPQSEQFFQRNFPVFLLDKK